MLRLIRFGSIRTKMLMFAVVATLLPSLTTVWISYIENKRALSAKASEELLGLSAQAAREVDLWTKELRYNLRVFSSSYEVTENLERIPLVNGEPIRSGIYQKRLTDYLNSVRDRFPDYAELLVLATGAGSLILSHVNDAGFWLVNQSFKISVGDTFKTWSVMETLISVVSFVFISGLWLVT